MAVTEIIKINMVFVSFVLCSSVVLTGYINILALNIKKLLCNFLLVRPTYERFENF